MKRIIIGITGASGALMGVKTIEALSTIEIETHLVVSKWGRQTLEHETGLHLKDLRHKVDHVHASEDMSAPISSGSFRTIGMAIIPCSMHSLAAISLGIGENLLHRAAQVVLKERLPLVLVPRETPLADIHLENMLRLSRMGARIVPPNPGFYNHPESIDDIVNHIVTRVLDQFGIETNFAKPWDGNMLRTN